MQHFSNHSSTVHTAGFILGCACCMCPMSVPSIFKDGDLSTENDLLITIDISDHNGPMAQYCIQWFSTDNMLYEVVRNLSIVKFEIALLIIVLLVFSDSVVMLCLST